MSKTLLVGLTGGIGSGKSTVAKLFEILSIPVYYADDRGKWLLSNDQQLQDKVISLFGSKSYLSDGNLNRAYLAEQVFPNPDKLQQLNAIVHPAVAEDFTNWIQINSNSPYLMKEAALILENESYKKLDKVICVMASKSERVKRVLLRDEQRSEEQVLQIMEKQVSNGTRTKLSDFLIYNDGSSSLIKKVLEIHAQLISASN